jgi:hypothetical protein
MSRMAAASTKQHDVIAERGSKSTRNLSVTALKTAQFCPALNSTCILLRVRYTSVCSVEQCCCVWGRGVSKSVGWGFDSLRACSSFFCILALYHLGLRASAQAGRSDRPSLQLINTVHQSAQTGILSLASERSARNESLKVLDVRA